MLRVLLMLLVVMIESTQAFGAIIVNVESKNFAAGGLGFVEVYISSDETTVDEISLASYEFQITPTGPNGTANGELLFRLNTDQLADEETDPSYVFFSDNTGITTVVSPNQLTIQGDDTDGNGSNVLLTATPKLLARFELVHTSATPSLAVGDTFSIGLINNDLGNADPLDDSTFFADNLLNVLAYQAGSDPVAFANFGTITITSAAVPEPSTFAVMALVGAGVVGRKLRRRKAVLRKTDDACAEI